MRIHKILFIIIFIVGFCFWNSCSDNPSDYGGGPTLPPPIPIVVYNSPIWHPSGKFIGFNHIPIKNLHYIEGIKYPDRWEVEPDSNGFWLINVDGTNMRRIFPIPLQTPVWSPDGEWIAFVSGTQIFKMRFTGDSFDTTSLTQLTTEGRNFFPSWSPDGQWIAFDNTDCGNALEPPPPNSCGLLMMKNNGTNRRFLVGGRMPDWSPNGINLAYIGFHNEIYKVNVWDTTEVSRLTSFNQIDPYKRDNRYPQYSPKGSKIAFWSNGNIWLMDSIGSSQQQLTTEGASDHPFSWHPTENLIVFTQYRFDEWLPQNGTLWILNIDTGEKHQLTYNPEPTD